MEHHELVDRIDWAQGEPIPGTPFRQVVTAAQTEGRLVVLAADMPPGVHVDAHVHADEDQVTVVVQGLVGCRVDGTVQSGSAGAVLLARRGQLHELWNAGDTPARVLEFYTPAGFEQVFIAAGARAVGGAIATGDDYRAAQADSSR